MQHINNVLSFPDKGPTRALRLQAKVKHSCNSTATRTLQCSSDSCSCNAALPFLQHNTPTATLHCPSCSTTHPQQRCIALPAAQHTHSNAAFPSLLINTYSNTAIPCRNTLLLPVLRGNAVLHVMTHQSKANRGCVCIIIIIISAIKCWSAEVDPEAEVEQKTPDSYASRAVAVTWRSVAIAALVSNAMSNAD